MYSVSLVNEGEKGLTTETQRSVIWAPASDPDLASNIHFLEIGAGSKSGARAGPIREISVPLCLCG